MHSNFRIGSLLIFCSMFILACQPGKKEVDVDDLVNQMTLDEKLDFIGGYESFNIRGIERLGIPEIRFADGPVGVRNYGKSTAYPASITLAASWDTDIAYNTGKAIALEAKVKDVQVMLAPGMNIYRSARCGRNFEYLGEDPYLAGQMAKAYINGMQKQGVMATAKHFVANNQEFNRHQVSSDMDERTLHEIYLPAFKTCVQEAYVAAVMSSYNLINGVHASQNDYLLNTVLKGDWGFDGFVMSDWVSTYNGLACAKAGLDLEMPSGRYMHPDTLRPAIESGELDIALINDKIRRILNTYKRFGFFNNGEKTIVLDSSFVRNAALDAARGGIVLLKNDAQILPLDRSKIKKIAVIGPNGDPAVTGGGGSSEIDPLFPVSLLDALIKKSGNGVEVTYAPGVMKEPDVPAGMFDTVNYYTYVNGQKVPGVTASFYENINMEGQVVKTKVFEHLSLEAPDMIDEKVPEFDYSVRFTTCFSPEKDGGYAIALSGDDGYRLFIDDKLVLENWRMQGETPRIYAAHLQKGKEYKLKVEYFQGLGGAAIRLGIKAGYNPETPEQMLAKAVDIAKQADVVIMAVGFNNKTEAEGNDRTYEMPYGQSDLINAIAKVNRNVVTVLYAGGNVEMSSWINQSQALLHAWYPGQEGALAIGEIIFGEISPSGKLPVSFEANEQDNPTYNSYFDTDNDLHVFYSEGIFIGYRYYDKSNVKPRFPFGYGLSYTAFEYSGAETDKKVYANGEQVKIKLKIKNTGAMQGAEAVQLYVSDKVSSLPRPEKELKAFDKVNLAVGEEKEVEFVLDKSAFSYYRPDQHQWVLEPGEFEIKLGSSSADIRQVVKITIE